MRFENFQNKTGNQGTVSPFPGASLLRVAVRNLLLIGPVRAQICHGLAGGERPGGVLEKLRNQRVDDLPGSQTKLGDSELPFTVTEGVMIDVEKLCRLGFITSRHLESFFDIVSF